MIEAESEASAHTEREAGGWRGIATGTACNFLWVQDPADIHCIGAPLLYRKPVIDSTHGITDRHSCGWVYLLAHRFRAAPWSMPLVVRARGASLGELSPAAFLNFNHCRRRARPR